MSCSIFFFFKQKTAYESRISDWSSDVCSSDLKYTEGFTRLAPSIWTAAAMVASMGMLGLALKTLPLGTAYAIWTGIGTVGTAIFGMIVYGESADPLRLACIGLIVAGKIGRAACWGRVCSSGLISVGRGILKKKNHT